MENLFIKRINKKLCENCYKFHTNRDCKVTILTAMRPEVKLANIPEGRHALVTYADFESVINHDTTHEISGYSFISIDKNGKIFSDYTENALTSENLIEEFLDTLFSLADLYANIDVPITDACAICSCSFDEDDIRINRRNFINGYLGSCHSDCWHDYKNTMFVFFHNFRGYDSHFLMETICTKYNVRTLTATNMEKFNIISISRKDNDYISITFKDTFNFFTTSLAKCVDTVKDWRYTDKEYRDSKGIFPYEWFDDINKLRDESLPDGPWESKLTNTLTDSAPAKLIWDKLGMKTFGEYHDFYCRLDTFQLADVFEEFRRSSISEFNTDPVYFMGAPALSWYLGVKSRNDLFSIIRKKEIYLDIQSQIRGGVSQAMVRYHKVDPDKDSIFFLDVNSLYSKCMTYKMPTKYLRRLDELPRNWQQKYNPETEYTALLCVDLDYPAHLHDRDWAYPLMPHKYNDRLCTTFLPKEKYLIHAELLQFYMSRGIILTKFHYLYEFEQEYTLRDYVENNIIKRRNSESEVMKTLYKLLNNSLYGKTCENVFKYRQFKVIQQEEDETTGQINEGLANAKNFIAYDDSFLIEEDKTEIILNKPIQIGFTILEFAKREIYEFIAVIQDELGDNVIPMYTDTDSIMFLCNFTEPWKKFYHNKKIRPFLDFDKVPSHWGVRTPGTNKQNGLWSVEADGKTIVEYVGLRSKCYAYMFQDGEFISRNKGVPKSSVAYLENGDTNTITFEDYKNSLFKGKDLRIKHLAIRSEKHQVTNKEIYKLGISDNDFKRTVHKTLLLSLPFGYSGTQFDTNDLHDPDLLETWHPRPLVNGRW